MSFAHPLILLALPVVLAASVGWLVAAAAARRRASALTRRRLPAPPHLSAVLLSAAAASAVLAAAGPRWGSETLELPREGADVVFIVDVSRSMAATDVGESRLAAARQAIEATIVGLEGDRVGLIIFGGSGYLRMPPTTDLEAASEVAASLDAGAIFVDPGSSIAHGLAVASTLPAPEGEGVGRVFVLVSDGDDLGADPLPLAERIGQAGVDVIVAGVGTASGATIPVAAPGSTVPVAKLDDSGEPLVTRLDEPLLLSIARAANGRYLGTDLASLPGVVQGRLASLRDARLDERAANVPIERFQLFVAVSLVMALAAIIAEKIPAFMRRAPRHALPIAAVFAVFAGLFAGCAEPANDANSRGLDAFAAGDYPAAARLFTEARLAQPRDFQVALNLALALFAAGEDADALAVANEAAQSARPELRGAASAAAGNIYFARGDLQEALQAFEQALRADPRPAYRHDYEVILRLLQPAPGPSPTVEPSATPQAGETPPGGDPRATPEPSGSPGSGGAVPIDPAGTPQPGDPGSELPDTPSEVDDRIDQIDQQVALLLPQPGEPIDREAALEIIELLAERARLAGLRESLGGRNDPGDY